MIKWIAVTFGLLMSVIATAQVRDTLKLTITKVSKQPSDTVFMFSSRIDTIALQPVKTDTSKMVKDVNPQDMEETKYKVKLLGQIRVNSYYDFNGMTSTEGFLPYDIPVGEDKVEGLSSIYIGGRQSRFGIEGTANTKVGSIRVYLDVDFASSTESLLRLRHAFVEWNYFKIGHTWSTFMDNASLPNTVDFEGPNSSLSKRHGVVRYERLYAENTIIGLSVESPATDYYNPLDSIIEDKNKQGNFDIAARIKHIYPWGHIQAAGIYRRISYLNVDEMNTLHGWGILMSTILNINRKNTVYAQYSVGEGIAHYYVGFSNRGLDAVYNPNTNKMMLKPIKGSYITINHFFKPNITLSGTAGLSNIKCFDFEPGDSFWSSQYLAITFFYKPIETISLGAEVTTGTRKNFDSQKGNATRISFLGSFNF